jgi:hypothetical protein
LNEERNLPHVAARMPHDIDERDRMCAVQVRAVRAISLCKPVAPLRLPVWSSISAAEKNPAL